MTTGPSESVPVSALTRLQHDVRAYLRAHSGEIISREQLCREVWGMRYFSTSRTVDQTISVVRKHLDRQERILTVFRIGYRHLFVPNAHD
jgi:DNA-binding response OmpR family regulator